MKKNFKNKNFSKVDEQLNLLDKKKKEIFKDLYNSYELYLTFLRSEIFNAAREGIMSLFIMANRSGRQYEKDISILVDNEIKLLINQILPFLTIEQLTLFNDNNIDNDKTINEVKQNKFIDENDFNSEILNKEDYFQNDCYSFYINKINNNLKSSIDLDKNSSIGNYSKVETNKTNTIEEKQFLISGGDFSKIESNFDDEYNMINSLNIFEENHLSNILKWSDGIDIGLNSQLRKISIEINQKIFKNIFAKQIVPENLVKYLFDNNFLTTNPKPYIILFDLLSYEFIYNNDFLKNLNLSKIYLFCISPIELEFNNIKLNILRNKISKLRDLLKILIKKEQYWSNKRIISNYDIYKMYKN